MDKREKNNPLCVVNTQDQEKVHSMFLSVVSLSLCLHVLDLKTFREPELYPQCPVHMVHSHTGHLIQGFLYDHIHYISLEFSEFLI